MMENMLTYYFLYPVSSLEPSRGATNAYGWCSSLILPVSFQSALPAGLKDADANFSLVTAPLTPVASSNHHLPLLSLFSTSEL